MSGGGGGTAHGGQAGNGGRTRRGWGPVGFMLLYLVVVPPPLFLLCPFVLLLAVSRPTTWREWAWFVAGAVGVGAWMAAGEPGDLVPQVVRASGTLFAGAFVVQALVRPGPPLRMSMVAGLIAAAALAGWGAILGVGIAVVNGAVEEQLRTAYSLLFASDPTLLQAMLDLTPMLARLFPALQMLLALAGGVLAWELYHWVAVRPLGAPAGRFGAFRFNDHLIWGALATLGLALSPLGDPWRLLADNALVVWGALYVVRGLAVLWTPIVRVSLIMRIALLLATVVLLPFAAGGLLAIGLADTWLDIRRRFAPPPAP